MGYKFKGAFKRGKPIFIVMIILWVVMSIVLIVPASVSVVEAKENGVLNFGKFIDNMMSNFSKFSTNLGKVFTPNYAGTFGKGEMYLTVVLLIFGAVGFIKSMPKNEYTNIEHGSSDWATGEQYKVLNPRKGILLAEKHYLPVDKRGNVNVLVVGRFRFW